MYLAKIQTIGFRALDSFFLEFKPGLNVIVGPNNSGKTAILEAISLALSGYNPYREIYPRLEDFWHSSDGKEKEDLRFEITLELRDIPNPNTHYADWMVTGEPERIARISLVCTKLADDKIRPRWEVGMTGASLREESIERVRPVFLPPLRDAENALKPGRNSRLAKLVQQIGEGDKTKTSVIVSKFKTLQDDLITDFPFSDAIGRVNTRLSTAAGARHKQVAQLEFVEPNFKKITENLQMNIGLEGLVAYALSENGVGYNNLLYIATVP